MARTRVDRLVGRGPGAPWAIACSALEHIGSTAVPGLAAKPVIDPELTVADRADEAAYVPALEPLGLPLRIREPDWEEHRLLPARTRHQPARVRGRQPEPGRHLLFRDWLRTHDDDRAAYAALKAELGGEGFGDGMDYNNHKAALVYDIYERIFAADPAHEHDPQPRGLTRAPDRSGSSPPAPGAARCRHRDRDLDPVDRGELPQASARSRRRP